MSTNVIFFDGFCGVCDAVVSHLIPYAERAHFKFSSLQGTTYPDVLKRHPELKDLDSVVYIENFGENGKEIVRVRSDAALAIANRIGAIYKPLQALKLMPRAVRDRAYDLFARNRTKIFPPRDSCRLPTPEERQLFLP